MGFSLRTWEFYIYLYTYWKDLWYLVANYLETKEFYV